MEVPQKIKKRITMQPTSLLDVIPKIWKCLFVKVYAPDIHSSIIHDGQDVEIIEVSFDRGLDKEEVIHIYNEWNIAHPEEKTKYFHLQKHG